MHAEKRSAEVIERLVRDDSPWISHVLREVIWL